MPTTTQDADTAAIAKGIRHIGTIIYCHHDFTPEAVSLLVEQYAPAVEQQLETGFGLRFDALCDQMKATLATVAGGDAAEDTMVDLLGKAVQIGSSMALRQIYSCPMPEDEPTA